MCSSIFSFFSHFQTQQLFCICKTISLWKLFCISLKTNDIQHLSIQNYIYILLQSDCLERLFVLVDFFKYLVLRVFQIHVLEICHSAFLSLCCILFTVSPVKQRVFVTGCYAGLFVDESVVREGVFCYPFIQDCYQKWVFFFSKAFLDFSEINMAFLLQCVIFVILLIQNNSGSLGHDVSFFVYTGPSAEGKIQPVQSGGGGACL